MQGEERMNVMFAGSGLDSNAYHVDIKFLCGSRFEPCDKIVPALKAESGRPVACHLSNGY
jgi:hypothetical protein